MSQTSRARLVKVFIAELQRAKRASEAPCVRKIGKPSSRENLVMTSPYERCPSSVQASFEVFFLCRDSRFVDYNFFRVLVEEGKLLICYFLQLFTLACCHAYCVYKVWRLLVSFCLFNLLGL